LVNLVITNSYDYDGVIRGFVPLTFTTPYFFDATTRYYVFAKDFPRARRCKLPYPIVGGIKEKNAEELKLEFRDSTVYPGIPVKETISKTGKVYKICTDCVPWGYIFAFVLKESKNMIIFPKKGSVSLLNKVLSPEGGIEVAVKVSAKSTFYLLQHDGIEGEAYLVQWEGYGLKGKLEASPLG